MKTEHYSVALYPIKYVHGYLAIGEFVVTFAGVWCDSFIHIRQGFFIDTLKDVP